MPLGSHQDIKTCPTYTHTSLLGLFFFLFFISFFFPWEENKWPIFIAVYVVNTSSKWGRGWNRSARSANCGPEERAIGLQFDLLKHKLLTLLNSGCDTRGSLMINNNGAMGCVHESCLLSFPNNRLSFISILIAMHQSCSNQIHYIPVTLWKKKNRSLDTSRKRSSVNRHLIIWHKTCVLTTREH